MSDLTERLRATADKLSTHHRVGIYIGGTEYLTNYELNMTADLIDAIDARHIEKQEFSGGMWVSLGCKECITAWPCPTNRLIHPEE